MIHLFEGKAEVGKTVAVAKNIVIMDASQPHHPNYRNLHGEKTTGMTNTFFEFFHYV